jgi:hypothetical protein
MQLGPIIFFLGLHSLHSIGLVESPYPQCVMRLGLRLLESASGV